MNGVAPWLVDFAGRALHLTRQGQVAVAALAREDVPRLAAHAAGPAPHPAARRQLLDTFAGVAHNALRELVGFAGDGTPLGWLFAELAPLNVNGVRDALAFGVATGRPARLIARDVHQASAITLGRAMTITALR
jgi:hypothetical protein